jgi:hypothetical protein
MPVERDGGPAVPPEGGQPGGSNPSGKVPPEGTRPTNRAPNRSQETRVAPENTRTVISTGGMPEGTRPLKEGAAPPERTRTLPLEDSGNH